MSKLAHASLYSGVLVFPVTLWLTHVIADRIGDSVPDTTFLKYLAMAIVTTHALALSVAIVALVRVRSREGETYGHRLACVGLICSILSLVIMSGAVACGVMGG